MASTNQSPFYKKAEENFLNAKSDEEKLKYLEEMIRECPKHKSSEKMLANLKTRKIKLVEKIDRLKKSRKSGKSSAETIKKLDMQVAIIGNTNSGKSSIMSKLTNANTPISEIPFTTRTPIQGIMDYEGVQIQIIDLPSIKDENFDIGIANTADLLLIIITDFNEIEEILNLLPKAKGNKLILFNKSDTLTENEKRKISERLKSKKYNFVLVSINQKESIEELKEAIFRNFDIIRIYLKEPGKEPSHKPMIMPPDSTVLDVANKISHHLAKTLKEIHIWGPSSKFPNQKVGINHKVLDKDIIEFKTK